MFHGLIMYLLFYVDPNDSKVFQNFVNLRVYLLYAF